MVHAKHQKVKDNKMAKCKRCNGSGTESYGPGDREYDDDGRRHGKCRDCNGRGDDGRD